MRPNTTAPEPNDDVLVRFVDAYRQAVPDARPAVLADHAAHRPNLAADFERLARTIDFEEEYQRAPPEQRPAVLDTHCTRHPRLANEFRLLARGIDDLEASRPQPVRSEPPECLGRFLILRKIATGGMGVIFEALDQTLFRRVALKIVRTDRDSADAQRRFRRERLVLARLHHTHLISILTAGEEEGWHYFAMPYIDGLTLHDLILAAWAPAAACPRSKTPGLKGLLRAAAQAAPPEGGDIPLPASVPVPSSAYCRFVGRALADAAEGLHHAHAEKLVHRDVKPRNLMVDGEGHCWVIDFGLGMLLRAAAGAGPVQGLPPPPGPEDVDPNLALLTDPRPAGTAEYMAPEQWDGTADERTDVWGLGMTLRDLLCFRPAGGRCSAAPRPRLPGMDPAPEGAFPAGVPKDLKAICRKALRRDAAQRYPTALALAEDLRRWLGGEPTTARPARVLRRFGLWCLRQPGWALALAALLSLVGLGVFLLWLRTQHAEGMAAAAAARERDNRAEALHQEALHLRLGDRRDGWSRQVEDHLRQLRQIRADGRVRDEWANSFLGLDAHLVYQFRDGGASSVAFDTTGSRLILGGRNAEPGLPALPPRLWAGKAEGRMTLVGRPGGGPVGFRPDGTPVQLLVDAKTPDTLVLWDMARGQAVREFKVESPEGRPAAPVEVLSAMTPTGSFVAAACRWPDQGGTLTAWDAANGRVVRQWRKAATALALAPDGTLLAAGDEEGQVSVWPLAGPEPCRRFRAEREAVHSLAIGRDNRWRNGESGWLLAAGYSGSVTLWDLHAGMPRAYFRGSHYRVSALTLAPDATLLATGAHGEVRLWDAANGRLLLVLHGPNEVLGLTFSPDGRRLVLGGQHSNVFDGSSIWELEPGRGTRTLHGLTGQVAQVCWSRDGKLLAALAHNWEVAIWDLDRGLLRGVLEVPRGFTADNAGLAFSPDGRLFAFAAGSRAKVWEAASGREVRSVDLLPGLVDALAFDPSGKKLFLFRVETRTGKPPLSNFSRAEHPRIGRFRDLLAAEPARWLAECADCKGSVFSTMPACDGTAVAVLGFEEAGGIHARLGLYDSSTGARRWWVPREPSPSTTRLEVDPAGKMVALAVVDDQNEKVRLLDLADGRELGTLPRYGSLSPGAKYVSGRGGGLAFVLSRRDGREPLVTLGSDLLTASIHSRFSRDGRLLAWGNGDGTVTVCDLPEVRRRLAEVGLGWEP
jgi:serine/threonine protein kinase/WD40 repeat protein